MVRDVNEWKARFDLLLPLGVPYDEQFLTRIANLMTRWAIKYDARNWEKAQTDEEYNRFRESALRHMMQWYCWDESEDHGAAVFFNILWAETTKYKILLNTNQK